MRLRCKWHARADFGWLIRCELPRRHSGDHMAHTSALSPVTWPKGWNER
jgi:hypothetical protein